MRFFSTTVLLAFGCAYAVVASAQPEDSFAKLVKQSE